MLLVKVRYIEEAGPWLPQILVVQLPLLDGEMLIEAVRTTKYSAGSFDGWRWRYPLESTGDWCLALRVRSTLAWSRFEHRGDDATPLRAKAAHGVAYCSSSMGTRNDGAL